MLQQILALIVIIFFLLRLIRQKKKQEVGGREFLLWLVFWLLALMAIVFIKPLDQFVKLMGFSGAGINLLLYLVVLVLIYLVFKMRLKIVKLDKNLSELNQEITLKKAP
jgi:hypothetical protein